MAPKLVKGTLLVNLPLVDTFIQSYEVWKIRSATLEEMTANASPAPIKVTKIECISDAHAAADYIARVGLDIAFGNHIQTALSVSPEYKAWRKAMPSKTPPQISRYQKDQPKSNFSAVSQEINQYGSTLSPGQCLFHGGFWPGGANFTTTRPLSTSLCPQVALRNAEHNSKAYDAGQLHLFVLRATSPTTKAFVFKQNGTKLGHESEVLLASGAVLTLKNQNLIRSDYLVGKYNFPDKIIPIYLLEVDLS